MIPQDQKSHDFLNNGKAYLTQKAWDDFKKEHELLVQTRRPKAVERLSEARAMGDLNENNEYVQAKQDLSFIDGRIEELDEIFKKAVLIEKLHTSCQIVDLGCRVTVKVGKTKHVFHLVGEWEADPENQKISHESPLGQALIGKKIGDKVEIEAPVGRIVYTVLRIE